MKAKLSQSLVKQITLFSKVLVIVVVVVMLYFKLKDQEKLINEMKAHFINGFANNSGLLILVIILMPLNWFMESLKWRLIAGKIVNLSGKQAFIGVLSGLTVGFATPHGIGDYLGRIMTLKHRQRFYLMGGIMLGRLSQLGVTLIFGMIGVFYLFGMSMVGYALAGALVLLVILLFAFNKLKKNKTIGRFINKISEYTPVELMKIIMLSFGRYMVFSVQFLVVLFVFLPKSDLILNTAGVTWIFLSKSILPSFNFLSDLGIREYSAIYFFENYQIEIVPVLCASLLIWMINILAPTIIGIPLVLKLNSKAVA